MALKTCTSAFEFDTITFKIMYGPEKYVNERLMRNAHYIILEQFLSLQVPVHDKRKRDVIWSETC